jgi:beta-lactamase class A
LSSSIKVEARGCRPWDSTARAMSLRTTRSTQVLIAWRKTISVERMKVGSWLMSKTTKSCATRLCTAVVALLVVVGCSGAGDRDTSQVAAATGGVTRVDECQTDQKSFTEQLRRLESEKDGTVGVFAVDTETGQALAYREGERFAFASTGKALTAAVVLQQLSSQALSRPVFYNETDLVPYSPVTELHVEDGMTVRELLDAAVTISDNTAANLLLDLIGGPQGLDRALEAVGDEITEAVRREPELNDYTPGDTRDTTTPRAIAMSLAAYATGTALDAADQRLLNNLLRRNTTGDALIRAAVPTRWQVGDKTGSASYGTRNDIAVITPPGRAPIVLAVLTRHDRQDAPTDDTLVSDAAQAVVDAWCS